ncbi:antiviral reverse transcriptase Drt2 [Teredinibacter turnerae]|uniref:antiviral reverse transcriptase Drt2 n=1 Tax=Teredinibacter turnerae TaxID=2426 RepID=UPI0003738295|nr:antiviral reverse transcriptase Drt2 [Teredinibacter turnerae]
MEDQNDWFKQRHYLHFDRPIGKSKAASIATSPHAVSEHSFYPFLSYEVIARKIFKENGNIQYKDKVRPIAFASHVDSHIYSYYGQLLYSRYEQQIEKLGIGNSILAFRRLGKSNIDFALDAFNDIQQRGSCTAIAFDISGFFDNLDHEILRRLWCSLFEFQRMPDDHFAVFKSITNFSIVDRKTLFAKLGYSINNLPSSLRRICTPLEFRNKVRNSGLIEKNKKSYGIPQGSPISAILSNIYMLEFDKFIFDAIEEQGGSYYRYCDDMLFIVPTEWRNNIADLVRREIKNLKIDINPKKTEIRDFSIINGRLHSQKPLQYLGFIYDGEQITIRSAAFAKYSARMRKAVRLAKKKKIKENRLRIQKGIPPESLYKKKLFSRYSHLGKQNFVRYGLRAAEKMNSKAIKRQMKPLWKRLQLEIEK